MFIFSRRAIGKRLHSLVGILEPRQGDNLAARLNTPGRDRLAAMWEVIFLYGFSQVGGLKCEPTLASGKRPDVAFTFAGEDTVGLYADITAVSDEGLDKDNPIKQLSTDIAREAKKAGLPPGGINYRVEALRRPVRGGDKVMLQLPSRAKTSAFIKEHVRPFLHQAKIQGAGVAPLIVDSEGVRLTIGYDGSRFSTGSYPSFGHATSLDANPIMNQLQLKARKQLKGIDTCALRGIVVCDADCTIMRRGGGSLPLGTFGPESIARKFLRTNSSIDFVMFATVRSEGVVFGQGEKHTLELVLVSLAEGVEADRLNSLVPALSMHMPKPVKNVPNAALRCREEGVGDNSIGAYHMSSNHVRVSARALMDVLAGKMSPQEWESQHGWTTANPFLLRMMEGRGITKAAIIPGGGEDDDWIEFTFGERDAAMAPFTARKTAEKSE
jgi:hypothetical protein